MKMKISKILLLMACLAGSASNGVCSSPDEGWKAFGVRGGFSATKKHEFFHQYEAFATYGLPWSLRSQSGWGVALQANGAIGVLHAAGETGMIGSIGPGVIVDKNGRGFGFVFGGDLDFLGRTIYGDQDLNGHLLFDGHVGVVYRLDSGPGIGYRFQHMSNGGTNGKGNPGLDLHMFSLSWNF